MKVLLLSSLRAKTGNCSTAARIRNELVESGFDCVLAGVNAFNTSNQLQAFVQLHKVECAIGIHAWRAGSLLWDCAIPYSIVFGGTDINEYYYDADHMTTMTKAVQNARCLVAFSEPMQQQAIALWPKCGDRMIIQHQAVVVQPSNISFESTVEKDIGNISLHKQDVQKKILFLLAGGMRRVKDVLFLTQAISEWHKQDSRIYLVIVGPELDEEYTLEVKKQVQQLDGIVLMSSLQAADMHAAIHDCFALLNTSLSEGMATTILEAMALGVPVLARSIPANAAIIKHRETGLLFSNPGEFITLATELMGSDTLRKHLIRNAQGYVERNHSYEDEKRTYARIIRDMIDGGATQTGT